jgi:hypothetical protein
VIDDAGTPAGRDSAPARSGATGGRPPRTATTACGGVREMLDAGNDRERATAVAAGLEPAARRTASRFAGIPCPARRHVLGGANARRICSGVALGAPVGVATPR